MSIKQQSGLFYVVNNGNMATLTSKNLFVGYSTIDTDDMKKLVDLRLVEQDLLNHFNTKKNERVMMPGWGCGIWEYLFEPLDSVRESIIYEAQQVVANDPRVRLESIDVSESEGVLRILMMLYYVPFNAYGSFTVDFDKRSQEMI